MREIGLFRTEIVTDDGNFVSIPNATLFSGTIINSLAGEHAAQSFTVEVDRGENIDAVQNIHSGKPGTRGDGYSRRPRLLVEVDILGPILDHPHGSCLGSQRRLSPPTLSDLKKQVRQALQGADVRRAGAGGRTSGRPLDTACREAARRKEEAELRFAFSVTPGGGGCLRHKNPPSAPWWDRRGIGRNPSPHFGQKLSSIRKLPLKLSGC